MIEFYFKTSRMYTVYGEKGMSWIEWLESDYNNIGVEWDWDEVDGEVTSLYLDSATDNGDICYFKSPDGPENGMTYPINEPV